MNRSKQANELEIAEKIYCKKTEEQENREERVEPRIIKLKMVYYM